MSPLDELAELCEKSGRHFSAGRSGWSTRHHGEYTAELIEHVGFDDVYAFGPSIQQAVAALLDELKSMPNPRGG